MQRLVIVIALLVILAGCRNLSEGEGGVDPGLPVADRAAATARMATRPTSSPTPSPTATTTTTPTPTPTSTPTPTPTPTAQPLSVSGDPRAIALSAPSIREDIRCGAVDLFDFPLIPPEGDGVARGGADFGVYRSRYEQYHTGEDWWTSQGRSSFGSPVYSIGHGRVTYAAPLGWGRDQGIVIVQHTFTDGRQVLSFYGHLDPPSVVLTAGECVKRGQQVGNIGRPRTPPHLHFEIRTHMPSEPGGGYWFQDPTLAGWMAPSATIWQERLRVSPGVDWVRAAANRDSTAIGSQDEHTFLLLEEEQVIGLDSESGEPRWSVTPEERIETAVLDSGRSVLYVAGQLGQIEAFRLPDSSMDDGPIEVDSLDSLWQVDLDVVGIPALIPLPQGGVVIVVWNDVIGLSADGEVLWQDENFDRALEWLPVGDQLLLSTVGRDRSLWTIDEKGLRPWVDMTGGSLTAQGGGALLLNHDGLFSLNPVDDSYVQLSDWPRDSLRASDVVGLKDGGALVAYLSRLDRRLIRFDDLGNVTWQRSLPDEVVGTPSLLTMDGQPYLITEQESGNAGVVSVYAIDVESETLVRLFRGGTRTPRSSMNSVHSTDDGRLLLNIGGGHLVCFDVRAAEEKIIISTGALPQ